MNLNNAGIGQLLHGFNGKGGGIRINFIRASQ